MESVKRLEDSVAIVLTSQNHPRGTGYIAANTGATVYIPDQNPSDVDPRELISVGEIGEYEKNSEGELLGMQVFRDFYDFALLTEEGELIVSDNGRENAEGKLVLWPVSMDPPGPPDQTIHKEFRNLIQKSGADSPLAGHGHDIMGNLQDLSDAL